MTDKPSAEDTALWQRRLAGQANNRAWTLAEAPSRSSDEDEEMLQAAHAAAFFWRAVGNQGNQAHAAQLLAHVYALLKLPNPAAHFLAKSQPLFLAGECEPWEEALAHAVAANVASARKDHAAHAQHYRKALELTAALADPQDRDMLEATLRVLPVPSP